MDNTPMVETEEEKMEMAESGSRMMVTLVLGIKVGQVAILAGERHSKAGGQCARLWWWWLALDGK